MAFPTRSDLIGKMSPDFNTFFDTLYGMENAREILSEAYFYLNTDMDISNERRVLRSNIHLKKEDAKRSYIGCEWHPKGRPHYVGFRIFKNALPSPAGI